MKTKFHALADAQGGLSASLRPPAKSVTTLASHCRWTISSRKI